MSDAAPLFNTPKQNLWSALILFVGMATGIFLFMLIAVFINQTRGAFLPEADKYRVMLIWIMAAFFILCLFIARQQIKSGILAAKNSLNLLTDKLKKYRSSLIRYLAICEAPALLNIILFLLTGYFILLVFAAIILGFMLTAAPVRRKVVTALELDWQQDKELD